MDLNNDVKYVKGVGPNRVVLLNKLGINILEDLITYFPREYEDRSKPKLISEVVDGEEALISGFVISRVLELKVRKNLVIYKLTVRDESGPCTMTWYNQPYLKRMFTVGNEYSFYGKVSKKGSRVEMASPVFDSIENRKIQERLFQYIHLHINYHKLH
jgi:ATP-dependent DNA helicase RecG